MDNLGNNRVPIPIHRMASYGSLAFPLAAAFIVLQILVPTFYATATNLSLTEVGLVLLVARFFDLLADPIVGFLSDKTPSFYGKRKLWIGVATPLIIVACWYLFNPTPEAGVGYLLIGSIAIYVFGTMIIVPLNAWGAEMTADYDERSKITGTRAFFGLAGTLTALALLALLSTSNQPDDNSLSALGMQSSLTAVNILFSSSLLITVTLAFLFTPDKGTNTLPPNNLKSMLALLSEKSPFRQLITSFLFNGIGNAIPATLFLLYTNHVLRAPQYAGPLLLLYFVCTMLSIPVWLKLSERYGKHPTWMAAIVVAAAFFVWAPFLGPNQLWIFVVIVSITGFTTGADIIIPTAIKGDLIEWDMLRSGYRRPGLFFALWGTATKLAFALAIGLTFPLLDWLGFDPGSATAQQSSSSAGNFPITALAFLYGIPCVLFKLCAVWCMRDYPITRKEHTRIRTELAKLRN